MILCYFCSTLEQSLAADVTTTLVGMTTATVRSGKSSHAYCIHYFLNRLVVCIIKVTVLVETCFIVLINH